MDFIINFFKDTLSGTTYIVVVILSIFFIFAIIGFLGDRQKRKLNEEIERAKVNSTVKNSNGN